MGWQSEKDKLHKERKELSEEMRDGMFSKDQMNMLDCQDKDHEVKRVADYDNWKNKSIKGITNEKRMSRWSEINRKFKEHGEESRKHSIDDIRSRKNVKYI